MLVLTRRIGEEIVIAGNIRVKVVAVQGHQVRLGIMAPSSVPVWRMELLVGRGVDVALPAAGQIQQNQG
jgi:carbon storage regulator